MAILSMASCRGAVWPRVTRGVGAGWLGPQEGGLAKVRREVAGVEAGARERQTPVRVG